MTSDAKLLLAQSDQPDDGDAGFLGDYLLFLLAASSAAASAGFHAIVRAHGLRVPEWRALACLHDHDGQMITRLAALALMEQSAMTRVIERMEERGLVIRRGDARDRRRVRVHLSPAGRAMVIGLVEKARAHEAEVLALLPPEQRPALKPLLAALLAALPGNPLDRHGPEKASAPGAGP
jgi:DNA-binding MarR family transcriptional regulator